MVEGAATFVYGRGGRRPSFMVEGAATFVYGRGGGDLRLW